MRRPHAHRLLCLGVGLAVKDISWRTQPREPELLGQTVVVIGGSAGIGLETARRHWRESRAAQLQFIRHLQRSGRQ